MKIPYPKALMFMFFLGAISCEDKLDMNNESSDVVNALPDSQGKIPNNARANGSTINATPSYDGSDGGPIDLSLAKSWVKNFSETTDPDEIQSHYFGRDVIDQILDQNGCSGLRIYYALNDEGEKVLIISGVDNKGENMLPVSPTVTASENILGDFSWPCPTYCPGNGL